MKRPILLTAVAAVLVVAGAAQAQGAKPAPKAAARAAAPASVRADVRDPAALAALLREAQATPEVGKVADGVVRVGVTSPAYRFSVQYVDCAPTGRNCQALAFSTGAEKLRANLSQLNAFNQTSLTCRVFQDAQGRPNVMYATLLSAGETRDDLKKHLSVWMGCVASFGEFLNDPVAYLASAP